MVRKRGITISTLAITIVILAILISTASISGYKYIEGVNKRTFALEISNIQDEIYRYYRNTEDSTYPILNSINVNLVNVTPEMRKQFTSDNTVTNMTLYEIDLKSLGVTDTKYGNYNGELDKYVVSIDSGKVYYLKGVKADSKTYYTLTDELDKELNKASSYKNNTGSENEDKQNPTIDISNIVVNDKMQNDSTEIYISNIKIADDNIKKIKYETKKIPENEIKDYFKTYGKTLKDNTIKVTRPDPITVYAEDASGNFSYAYIVNYGNPVVPRGFKYKEGTKATGFVIIDITEGVTKGNEFVWVPVENINNFVRTEWLNNAPTSGLAAKYTEPFSNGSINKQNDLTGEYAEYDAMKMSIEKYGGFYIARYEAGKEGTDTIVSKKGATVWTSVKWGDSMTSVGTVGAVYRSRQMYKDNTYVMSHLIYGVQWDATLRFIASTENNVTASGSWGNYTGTLQTSGKNEAWKSKNIYDIAGNVYEWTMEGAYTDSRVNRGGYSRGNGNTNPASYRHSDYSTGAYDAVGFRVALYIK